MPPSKDLKKRAAQLRNLRPDAATKHGVYSEANLAPLRAKFEAELAEQFAAVATPDEIVLAADRRAKLEVLNDWLGRSGLLADKRSGRPRAVVQLADRLQSAYERQLGELRRRGGGYRRPEVNHLHIELHEDERVAISSTDSKVRADAAHRILARLRDEGAERAKSDGPAAKLDLHALRDEELDSLEQVVERLEDEQ